MRRKTIFQGINIHISLTLLTKVTTVFFARFLFIMYTFARFLFCNIHLRQVPGLRGRDAIAQQLAGPSQRFSKTNKAY